MKKIATDIKTEDWIKIINVLRNDGWIVVSRYDAHDAGIDFDFIILKKNKQRILFGWDNWVEGEIKCSAELMDELSRKFEIDFTFGKPSNLSPFIIGLTKFQNWYNRLRKR